MSRMQRNDTFTRLTDYEGEPFSSRDEENHVGKQGEGENAGAAAAWRDFEKDRTRVGHARSMGGSKLPVTTRTNESTSHPHTCRRGLQEDENEGAHSLPSSDQRLNPNEMRPRPEDMKAAAKLVIAADEGMNSHIRPKVALRDSRVHEKWDDANRSVAFAKTPESRRTHEDLTQKRAVHTFCGHERTKIGAVAVTDDFYDDEHNIVHRWVPLPVARGGIGGDMEENREETNASHSVALAKLHEPRRTEDSLLPKVRVSHNSPKSCDVGAFAVTGVDTNESEENYLSVPDPIWHPTQVLVSVP